MENKNILDAGSKYSLKRLFILWLPAIFLFSVVISVIYIFGVEEVPYLSSSFSASTGSFWLNMLGIFSYSIQASSGLVIIILLCSLVYFFIVEVFSIIRLFKLRKIEQSGILKMLFRFTMAQATAAGISFLSFILIFAASLGVAFAYGYADLKMNVKEALAGAVVDDQEVIKNIQTSSSLIDIYDASGDLGAVLAKRDLKKKETLTTYEGVVLPLLIKFSGKDTEGRSFFITDTNSVVYTNFSKDRTDKIIIELAFNHLRYNPNPIVASSFKKSPKPITVVYLDDLAYVPFRNKVLGEINTKILNDFKATISSNEKIVSGCRAIDADNAKLIAQQESDYQKNCIVEANYSNCADFRQGIDENKSSSQESADVCRKNNAVLASQYEEFKKLKADVLKAASSGLEEQRGELSAGSYSSDTQSIYMRVIPDQDAFVYLTTLLHELFHHYSKGGGELPLFVNEGITDYLTYKSFKLSDYEMVNATGYFKEIQTAMALLEKIPEQELMTAYFGNNARAFEASFKKAFAGVDYKIFLSKGDAMHRETYEEIAPTFKLGFWDTEIDHPSVQDMRTFLGLDAKKFYKS